MGQNKRKREIETAVESVGLVVEQITLGRHFKVCVSVGGASRRTVFFSSSSGDVRAIKNFKSACKRIRNELQSLERLGMANTQGKQCQQNLK